MSPAEQLAHVHRWRDWMRGEAEALVDLACQTGLHGGGTWDEVLGKWSVAPLPPEERARHATVGPPRSAGPPPIEVRRVVEALAEYTKQQLAEFDRTHSPPMDVDEQLDRVRYEANDLAENMLKRFLGQVRPKTTTSSIFANARAGSRHLTGTAGPGLSTLSCKACGAPRKDGATSRVCEFCGSNF